MLIHYIDVGFLFAQIVPKFYLETRLKRKQPIPPQNPDLLS